MELKVTITLSDQLFALLEDKLPNLGRRVEKAITKELGAKVRSKSAVELAVTHSETSVDVQVETNPKGDSEQTTKDTVNAWAETAQPAIEEWPTDSKKLAEKIRAIMHRTRQRIEGEDYKENTASEAYKKYHKELSNVFIQIAVSLGYAKPSAIDTPEKAKAFSDECDVIYIDEKGFIATPPAPF